MCGRRFSIPGFAGYPVVSQAGAFGIGRGGFGFAVWGVSSIAVVAPYADGRFRRL